MKRMRDMSVTELRAFRHMCKAHLNGAYGVYPVEYHLLRLYARIRFLSKLIKEMETPK